MRMERYLTCEYCNYSRSSQDDGRRFDERDPFGALGRYGDPVMLCELCIMSAHYLCECCHAYDTTPMPYTSRNSIEYCQKCWDAGCDLVTCSRVPELPPRKLRIKRDQYGRPIQEPAFRTSVQNVGPTEEELRATYASLGFEYHMNTKPEEGA